MSLKSIKRKIIKFLLATVWTTGAVAVIKLEAEQPVHNREFFDDTRAKRVALVVFNPLAWLALLVYSAGDMWKEVFEDFFDDLRDFWRQP
ncbi:MAG TPA: hypothetical protein PL051_01355 [Candidatus Saccharibacteria bacterium]|nr:hypothetical protein [Candidatus Saccharibacteria bacterium]